jgi:hypothetical protein
VEELFLLVQWDEVMTCFAGFWGVSVAMLLWFVPDRLKAGIPDHHPGRWEETRHINPELILQFPALPFRFSTFRIRSSLEGEPDNETLFFPSKKI